MVVVLVNVVTPILHQSRVPHPLIVQLIVLTMVEVILAVTKMKMGIIVSV
jgi:hypothetical protein